MKAKELTERSPAELQELAQELGRELWKTRFRNFTNQLDNSAKLGQLRRDIARIKTVINQKARQA